MNTHRSSSHAGQRTTGLCPLVLQLSLCLLLLTSLSVDVRPQVRPAQKLVANNVLVQILRAEDERRWDAGLRTLLMDKSPAVRWRGALAAGRIGDEGAVTQLIALLQKDSDESVQAMAAFALGEIESTTAADALIASLSLNQRASSTIRSRAVEALGKIAAALPKSEEAGARRMKEAIVGALEFEAGRRSAPDNDVILLGVTAALRARAENAGKVIAGFLTYSDPRIRADSANALARLMLSDGNAELRKLVTDDPDPVVRANAARVLGATEDKAALEALMDRATKDGDLRVRVSAIRSLATLKDKRAAAPLLDRGQELLKLMREDRAKESGLPAGSNEIIEIATTVGRVLANSNDERAVGWFKQLRSALELSSPEVEIAFARVAPQGYQTEVGESLRPSVLSNDDSGSKDGGSLAVSSWRRLSNVAQGFGELASVKSNSPMLDASIKIYSRNLLRQRLDCRQQVESGPSARQTINVKPGDTILGMRCDPLPEISQPDFLRAYAAFKPAEAAEVFQRYLNANDVVVRATAAELLGELPPDQAKTLSLIAALPRALRDKDLNDAALAILDALGKQKRPAANNAIKTALASKDHLIRRKAVALLKANGAGDFSARIGTVQTRNTTADYQRALDRIGKQVRATVNTSRGSFVIEFLPEDAPLTVDNFVMLAQKRYFDGQIVPRVVPNFVIQTGDPRGDQNGGPGYAIRCEINQVPYDRGAVGMALSGKDTGGSQWFVTHSPLPHLDGGYTVFGHVVSGMDVVDKIVRGDIIRSITIAESTIRASKP